MKTQEEKEKEFKEYVAEKLIEIHIEDTVDYKKEAHNLIQDFKEEIEGFNMAMSDELEATKQELDKYKNALDVYYKAVHNE
jgi:hypothetical protein